MKNLCTLMILGLASLASAQADLAQSSIKGMFSRNADQITSLGDAFSEEQYNWRPAEGIRSVGESLIHVAKANYFFLMKMGFELPEGIDMMGMDGITGKANIMEAVSKSFDFTKEKITMVETDQLGDSVEMPFGEFNKMSTLLLVLEHSGEHKGQLIAYARSSGIAPPWSQ
ncbi:MAG: DinB family protein [Saprospiraceae bacterium]|nr:DinB family protein [Saprospiraceae bacterium]